MRISPKQIVQLIQNGQNPQQLAMTLLEQRMGNNPMGQNLLALAQQGKTKDIEQFARNLAKEQGIDYDTEFPAFKKMLGFK